MLSLVRISLVLVPLMLGSLLSAAIPPKEWLQSRSKRIDGVNKEQSPDVQRFDQESVNTEQSPDVQRFDEESVNNEQSPDVQRFDEESMSIEHSPDVQRFDEESMSIEHSPDVQRFDEESVDTERSPDVQQFDEEFYPSPNNVPAEVDQVADVFAGEPSEYSLPEILRRQYPHRPQCRFAGCGK